MKRAYIQKGSFLPHLFIFLGAFILCGCQHLVTGETDLWRIKKDASGKGTLVGKYSSDGQGAVVGQNEVVKIVFNRMFLRHMSTWKGGGEIVVFAEVQDNPGEKDSRFVTKVLQPQVVENAYLNFIDSTAYGPFTFQKKPIKVRVVVIKPTDRENAQIIAFINAVGQIVSAVQPQYGTEISFAEQIVKLLTAFNMNLIEFDCTFTLHPVLSGVTTSPPDVLPLYYGQYVIVKREYEERPEADEQSKSCFTRSSFPAEYEHGKLWKGEAEYRDKSYAILSVVKATDGEKVHREAVATLSKKAAERYDNLIGEDNVQRVEEGLRGLAASSIAFMRLEKIREASRISTNLGPYGVALNTVPKEISSLQAQLASLPATEANLETRRAIETLLQEKNSLRESILRDLLDFTGLYKTEVEWASANLASYKKKSTGLYGP